DFANDPEMAQLVQLFVSELPGRIDALAAAWAERRTTDLTRLAHQLKGAGGGYGFPAIGHAAGALEAGLRSLPAPGDTAALDRLKSAFAALMDLCAKASVRGR